MFLFGSSVSQYFTMANQNKVSFEATWAHNMALISSTRHQLTLRDHKHVRVSQSCRTAVYSSFHW